jgi:hypothetical protein
LKAARESFWGRVSAPSWAAAAAAAAEGNKAKILTPIDSWGSDQGGRESEKRSSKQSQQNLPQNKTLCP